MDAGVVRIAVRRASSAIITISSSEQLPARSPMPLIVHSICRAPACDRGQRVRHRQAQIVVAVDADDGAIAQRLRRSGRSARRIPSGRRVAHGVGDVHRARAGRDHRLRDLLQVIRDRCARRLPPRTRRRPRDGAPVRPPPPLRPAPAAASSSACTSGGCRWWR